MSQQSRRAAKRDQIFFTALENGYAINDACDAAGYARRSVYRWREADEAFAHDWARALMVAADLVEEEADRRGRHGYDEPVFYQGVQCGAKRRFSDALLLARLKALKPAQYRDGVFAQQNVTVVVRDFINEPKPAIEAGQGAPAIEPPKVR